MNGASKLILLMVIALGVCEAGVAQTPAPPSPEPFAGEFQKYLAAPKEKVFAAAIDVAGGGWATGYASGNLLIEEAEAAALANCQGNARLYRVTAQCEVIARNDTRVKPTPVIEYATKWVNGIPFIIGTLGELQVWVTVYSGGDPQALIYLVNGGSQPITFLPDRIRALDMGSTRIYVTTFSAAEYEKKVRNKQAWQSFFYGLAAGIGNKPQPQTSRVEITGPHGTFYSGRITSWPSAADYAAARERREARLSAMTAQLQASFTAMAATLARNHTLDPGSYYGGVVHFSRLKGQAVALEIPFGGLVFHSTFTLPGR